MTTQNSVTVQRVNEHRLSLRIQDGCTAGDLRGFVAEMDRLGVPDATLVERLYSTLSLFGGSSGRHLGVTVPEPAPTPPTPALDAPPVPEATPEPTEAAEGATAGRVCRSNYYADTDLRQYPGYREVRCSLLAPHGGDHEEREDVTGELVASWPQRKPEPRTWSLPAEPGPEVKAVRTSGGRVYRHVQRGPIWRWERETIDGILDIRPWHELLSLMGLEGEHITLTDATSEVS